MRELQNSGSVDFRVLLSRFSVFFQGVISTLRILPPEKKRKIGQNNPENRRTLSFATPSDILDCKADGKIYLRELLPCFIQD
jgi:hypothetical protein